MKKLIIITLSIFFLIGNGFTNLESPEKVSWETLLNVEWIVVDGNYQIKFNEKLKKLDGKNIEIDGYIFPLNNGVRSMNKFLLSAYPIAGCPYCAPGSSESFIMIDSKEKVRFQYEPITIVGKFELSRNSQYGIIYQMSDVQVK